MKSSDLDTMAAVTRGDRQNAGKQTTAPWKAMLPEDGERRQVVGSLNRTAEFGLCHDQMSRQEKLTY